MMTREYLTLTRNPTAHNPPSWLSHPDPTATNLPPSSSSPLRPFPLSVTNGSTTPTPTNYNAVLTALCRYIEAYQRDDAVADLAAEIKESGVPIDGAYASTDEFRMYEFKVRPCTRAKAHDWTECPFAHPGEKARRRDPIRFPYSGTACTDFRKGSCRRGDACEFAHGVFECWLHPTRYRTQACKDGSGCTRRVCFFAHTPDQLRVVSGQPSPRSIGHGTDPFEDLESSSSPLVTPIGRAYGSAAVNELDASLRNLQLIKVKSMPTRPGWRVHVGSGSPRFGPAEGPVVRPGFCSLPNTPTRPADAGYFDAWVEEEPVMERVESGRELRARMFEKLSKENPLTLPDPADSGASDGSGPDVGWVTELVK